jgi:hypothetical protein
LSHFLLISWTINSLPAAIVKALDFSIAIAISRRNINHVETLIDTGCDFGALVEAFKPNF